MESVTDATTVIGSAHFENAFCDTMSEKSFRFVRMRYFIIATIIRG